MVRLLAATSLLICLATPHLAQDKPAPKIKAADRAKILATKDTLRKLAGDLKAAKSVLGSYPERLDELVKNQLIEKVPKDGWDRDFVYAPSKSTGYELTSLGADGKAGGEGGDADIVWTEEGLRQTLSAEEAQALAARRAEQRQQGFRVIALFRMKALAQLALRHRREKSAWPDGLEDLKAGVQGDQQKLLAACFSDPWGKAFVFKALPNENFAFICYGSDGAEGGSGHAADFTITEREVRDSIRTDEGDWRGFGSNQDWRVEDLAAAVRQYRKANKKLPDELQDLTRGAQRIRNEIPKDAFGNEYLYVVLGGDDFHIISLGSDGRPGGLGDGVDRISPMPGQAIYEEEGGERDLVPAPKPAPENSEENLALITVAEAQMRDIMTRASEQQRETRAWPEKLDDLAPRLPGKVVPLDPWESPYEWELTRNEAGEVTGARVICRGCDKAAGGERAAADFAINELGERVELAPAPK